MTWHNTLEVIGILGGGHTDYAIDQIFLIFQRGVFRLRQIIIIKKY